MALISLLVKAFLLYLFFTFIMAAWRIFRTIKVIKGSHGQAQQDMFGGSGQGPFQQPHGQSSANQQEPQGDVFDAEYRVVKEENQS